MEECIDETSSPEERAEEDDVKDNGDLQEEEEQQTTEGIANESIQADDSTVFHKICYLGAETIGNPKDEPLIQGQIKAANEAKPASSEATEYVELSVPRTSEGWVVMRALDPARPTSPDEKDAAKLLLHAGEDDGGGKVLLRLPICRIIFFAKGNLESPEANCFALTSIQLEIDPQNGSEVRRFVTHIFRCQVPEAVTKVFLSFAQAFKRTSAPSAKRIIQEEDYSQQEAFLFEINLEIREKEEGKNNTYEVVPRQKGLFKLRSNVEKKVIITVEQISRRNSCHLTVERCFGMLVSPGRNVRHADMQLLEHVTMATTPGHSEQGSASSDGMINHVITGSWDPSETAFAVLNQVS